MGFEIAQKSGNFQFSPCLGSTWFGIGTTESPGLVLVNYFVRLRFILRSWFPDILYTR